MAITFGPNLGLMENATTGEAHDAELRRLLRGLDGLVQCHVKDKDLTAPPGSPVNGDCYIPASGATGVWAGQAGKIARYETEGTAGWEFFTPKKGWRVHVEDEGVDYQHSGAAWAIASASSAALYGTYASRPAAASNNGRVYYATDVQEVYVSNGTTWTLLPAGGSELGYAEITSTFTTTSTTAVDITGLSVTVVVGERPVVMAYGGNLRNTVSSASARIRAVANGVNSSNLTILGAAGFQAMSRETRVSGLTPGISYTFKLQLMAIDGGSGAGTSELYADANDKPYIQVRTA